MLFRSTIKFYRHNVCAYFHCHEKSSVSYNFLLFHLIRRGIKPRHLPLQGEGLRGPCLFTVILSTAKNLLQHCPTSKRTPLATGAWPLCVKGAVTTVVVTGGLSPSIGRRLSEHLRYNPSIFLLRKNPPPFAQGRL